MDQANDQSDCRIFNIYHPLSNRSIINSDKGIINEIQSGYFGGL